MARQRLDVLGKTAAENHLGLYNTNWNGDITRVFRVYAY